LLNIKNPPKLVENADDCKTKAGDMFILIAHRPFTGFGGIFAAASFQANWGKR
jgi:hypothetical protein